MQALKQPFRAVKAICDLGRAAGEIRRQGGASHPTTILHLIETGGPGGAERMLLDLARELGPEYDSVVGVLKPGWLLSTIQATGLSHSLVESRGLGELGILRHLLQIIREHHVRIIHSHEFYMNSVAAVLSRLTSVPFVATIHGRNYYPDKARRRALYRFIAGRASACVAVSADLKRFFCQSTGVPSTSVKVIYNGIETKAFERLAGIPFPIGLPDIEKDATILGSVGNLYPVKGHLYLIRALKAILASRPNTHLLVLGRGQMEGSLRAEARALGVDAHVHLPGFKEDAREWLRCMDVFIMPSLSEGLPLSLLEAMAAGVPVVASEVGGIPEVVRDEESGLLVPPADPAALARKIIGLLENRHLAGEIAEGGKRRVREHFSLDCMVRNYVALYEEALASSSRGALCTADSLASG